MHFFRIISSALMAVSALSASAANLIRVPINDDHIRANPPLPGGGISVAAPVFGEYAHGIAVTKDVTITNNRSSAVAIGPLSQASLSGTGFNFVSTTCGANLGAGQSCSVAISMADTGGSYASTLTVNAAGVRTVSLTGSRAPSRRELKAPFGVAMFATAGQTVQKSARVLNTGNVPLSSLALTGGWANMVISPGTCTGTLQPGEGCDVTFTFTNSSTRYGWYRVAANSSSGPVQYTGDLVGYNYSSVNYPGITTSPEILEFGEVTPGVPARRTVTITNGSGTSRTFSATSSMPNSRVTISGGTCQGATLPDGGTCTIELQYTPSTAREHLVGRWWIQFTSGHLVGGAVSGYTN